MPNKNCKDCGGTGRVVLFTSSHECGCSSLSINPSTSFEDFNAAIEGLRKSLGPLNNVMRPLPDFPYISNIKKPHKPLENKS